MGDPVIIKEKWRFELKWELSQLDAGTQVRLISDPGRVGVLTGKNRHRNDTVMYQVAFPDGNSYQPAYELEAVEDANSDVFQLLAEGRYGRLTDLRRNLSHIQLSGRLANLVYSMETTNTDFYAYQFKPVLSFLESPSNGLLIADEVGLGKTIEAGLIWTELRARYEARRLLVVCPAMLREKWKSELRMRFGVDANIIDAAELYDALSRSRHEDEDGRGYICSIQGLRPPRGWREDDSSKDSPRRKLARLLEQHGDLEPLVDLLIVDEAHYLRNPESQAAKLGQLLRDVSQHVVLLSATPINLKEEDLFHLLNLVDPDSFDVKEVFPLVLQANEPLQRARTAALDKRANMRQIKSLLREAQEHELLADSAQLKGLIEGELSLVGREGTANRIKLANRIERVNLLSHVVSRTRKIEVTEWKVVREPFSEFVKLNESERQFYDDVTDAVRDYALENDISEGFMLASPQRQISSSMYAAASSWGGHMNDGTEELYEDLGIDVEKNKHFSPLIAHIRESVMTTVDIQSLRANDSKYERFASLILEYLHKFPKEKVIVFSYFRATLFYLSKRLSEDGLDNIVLVGGMRESKQEIIDRFRSEEHVRVLLSSEVASEGVDLQFCRVLVNYDLPWNPMKVEQRIGRIDRIGQQADKINIWNLCYADTIDHRIHERLFERLGIFERALGGMEAILGEKIGALTNDLICQDLTKEQQNQRIEQTALAIERIRHDQTELENQASHLIAHGGYILEQVHAAHEFNRRITEEDLFVYVKDYLEKFGQGHILRQLKPDELVFEIRLSPDTAAALAEFIRRKKLFGKTRLATGDTVRCQFLNKLLPIGGGLESISQFHPLVRFICEDLKSRSEAFYPLVAVEVSSSIVPSIDPNQYVFAVYLWSFAGLRTEEELYARAVPIGGGTILTPEKSWELINAARLNGDDWLSVVNDIDHKLVEALVDHCVMEIEREYRQSVGNRTDENADRISFQMQSAQKHRDRQLNMHLGVLAQLEATDKFRLIPARKGLIRSVNERFEVQLAALQAKSAFSHSQFEVCFGVINIY